MRELLHPAQGFAEGARAATKSLGLVEFGDVCHKHTAGLFFCQNPFNLSADNFQVVLWVSV